MKLQRLVDEMKHVIAQNELVFPEVDTEIFSSSGTDQDENLITRGRKVIRKRANRPRGLWYSGNEEECDIFEYVLFYAYYNT